VLPVPACQLATGTILVEEPPAGRGGVALYARVSSSGDQRADLHRQVARVVGQVAAMDMAPTKVVSEVGSGLNGHRTTLLGLLRDPEVPTIGVEHRDRLARFGVEYLGEALASQGRRLVVIDDAEGADDLVRDMVELLTSVRARRYGRRSARRRASVAVEAAGPSPSVGASTKPRAAQTQSSPNPGQPKPRAAQRFMGSPRCSSAGCDEGTSVVLDETVTATRRQVAPKPVLVASDR